jgi:hypothetical protein
MKPADNRVVRCAIYTRVSTDSGLDQEFNSLDAQYDASQAYIRVRRMQAGRWSRRDMMMEDSLADRLIALPCSGCWRMSRPVGSTSLSSIRWTD